MFKRVLPLLIGFLLTYQSAFSLDDFTMITKRLTMKGLIVSDWLDCQGEFEKEVGGYFRAGKLKNKETVMEGIGQAVDAFIGLFEGNNMGKMVVELT